MTKMTENPAYYLNYCRNDRALEWYCHLLVIFCSCCLVLGFIGNMTALLSYIYYTKSWTRSNIFLFNLVLCDLAWTFTAPITIYLHSYKMSGDSLEAFCQIKKFVFYVNLYGSILFLTLISVDRYINTVHPIASMTWWTMRKVKAISICAWIFVVIESLSDFLYLVAFKKSMNTTRCTQMNQDPLGHFVSFSTLRFLFGFLLPISILLACYFRTCRVIRKFNQNHKRRQKSAKSLLLMSTALAVLIISFVPYHIMSFVMIASQLDHILRPENVNVFLAVYELSEIVCSINACLDPILYILANEEMQHRIKMMKHNALQICICCHSRRIGIMQAQQEIQLN